MIALTIPVWRGGFPSWCALLVGLGLSIAETKLVQADLREEALQAAKKGVEFLHKEVSTQGGYLWRYSPDLKLKEGEGVVTTATIWTQPPGTPTVGMVFLELFDATGEPRFLEAAKAAGEALRQGQMLSGGWQASVEFSPERRSKWAYRTNEKQHRRAKDQSSLDDDKTQASTRFVIQLDQALQFQDERVHEMALFAVEGLIRYGQFENGGFPQVYSKTLKGQIRDLSLGPARFPEAWSREYLGHQEYWYRLTLNDNLAPDVFKTLMLAHHVYGEERMRASAIRLADFLLLAQLPEPQPAWAQQYNYEMEPIWARKFEPAAVTGGESQGVIKTLLDIYLHTGERKYLAPIPRALEYLRRSELPNGQLARFYELETNRPLFFTRDYKLTYDDSDLPTHYAFKVSSRSEQLKKEYARVAAMTPEQVEASMGPAGSRSPLPEEIRQIIQQQRADGAWLSETGLRYHRVSGDCIDMRDTVDKLHELASFLRH